jgi:hypothetical protein
MAIHLHSTSMFRVICNHCLSPLTFWDWILFRWDVLDTTLCDKVCQWLATGRWFSPCIPVSSTNKTDRYDITEILLKVTLNTKCEIIFNRWYKKRHFRMNLIEKWYAWRVMTILWVFSATFNSISAIFRLPLKVVSPIKTRGNVYSIQLTINMKNG